MKCCLMIMTDEHLPSTSADCAGLLRHVLACLDRIAHDDEGANAQSLSLAALHVQQAIDLINPPNPLNS